MDKSKVIREWRQRALDANTALTHLLVTLEEWERQEVVSDADFMREIGILDAAGLMTGMDYSPNSDDLREVVTGSRYG